MKTDEERCPGSIDVRGGPRQRERIFSPRMSAMRPSMFIEGLLVVVQIENGFLKIAHTSMN
jgi:hypothetical protein